MPDYTSILRRSISALPDAAPAMREAVYQRARAALARQLTAVDPPLSSREIEAQHQQLESAVALIEAEFDPEPVAPPAAAPSVLAARSDPFQASRSESSRIEPSRIEARPKTERADPPLANHGEIAADRADLYDRDDYDDEDEEPSRAPFVIAMVVLALLVIGGGAFVYSQRDMVAAWTGLPIGTQVAVSPQTPDPVAEPEPAPAEPPAEPASDLAAAPDPESDKLADRLTNGEAAPPLVEPDDPADVAQAGNEDGLTGTEPPVGLGPDSIEPPSPAVPAPPPEGTAAPNAPAPGQSIVAQRAIFYEQGSEGAPGQAWQGTVTWSEVPRPDGSVGVQAVLQLPDQNVTATITISRNSDETLPASHLVEVEFAGDGRLGPAAVERVPALVLKPNEQARGQPLSGAAVAVTETLFWIALSSEDEQIERNLSLLREGSWFDLPILFAGGQRALITFEKGIPGDKVFETVLASWPAP